MTRATFVLPGGVGFCNAVRRTLMSDVEAWAPCDVEVRTNTSCQADEFLAHRIGMIPFRRERGGEVMELRVEGPGTAYARDLHGPGLQAVQGDIPLMQLGKGQALDLTVRFDKRPASSHARYAICAGLGMERVDGDGRHRLTLETIDDSPPEGMLLEALEALERRVDGALKQLAQQPEEAPRSMC